MSSQSTTSTTRTELSGQTIALRVIAAILIAGTFHVLTSILVPFMLALSVALALSPVADWLERRGCPRVLSSFAGLTAVVLILLTTGGLILFQAGSMAQESDRYLKGFSESLEEGAALIGAERWLPSRSDPSLRGASQGEATEQDRLTAFLRENAQTAWTWIIRGVGGLAGVLAATVLFLAFLFYMLQTRSEWIDKIKIAGRRLGLQPDSERLEDVRRQVGTYVKTLFFVSIAYMFIITLALWAIGVPQPLLWGVMTGLLEVIPYFGPVIASALPTIASLGTGASLWRPLAVLGLFAILQTIEGYIVAPVLYGNAVKIDPVTVLLGVLFFGFLWGPFGLALAMPTMILLRGLITITPETPALDALLVDEQDEP